MSPSVMVVDDEAIVAKDIQVSLESAGYAVPATASTGEEAIEKAAAYHPDLVLMDIHLGGGMDGIEAGRRVAELKIPVLYVTAYGDASTLKRAEATNPVGYVMKPFSPRDLRNAIELGMHRHQAERELSDALEEAQATNRALTHEQKERESVISGLAHDLRGPLGAVKLGVLRLARLAGEAGGETGTRTIRNIDRLDRMIQDILDAQRARAGKPLSLELRWANLVAIAADVVKELSSVHGNRFVLKADPAVEGLWSQSALWRTIWNLADNAVKYGAPESPVEISVHRKDSVAEICVHNDGATIPPERRKELFEPFQRLGGDGVSPGWGIGLTVVAATAHAHGGTVQVDSDDQSGTTFTVRLPLAPRPRE